MQEEITDEEIRTILRAAGLTAWSQLGELSPARKEELESWLQQQPRHLEWWTALTQAGHLPERAAGYHSLHSIAAAELEKFDRAYLTPLSGEASRVRRIPFLHRWGWVAASVILLLGAGAYLWTSDTKNASLPKMVAKTDIPPGKDGAILTLANGRQVVLDSLENGLIAVQNGAQAVIRNGELVYNATSGAATGEVLYNTMSTPKGRQFSLLLPDGTRVWLNAASSIRYPTLFTGNERRVEVTGEAYFEVAGDKAKPFKVAIADKAAIEVLGTSFNINAYNNEPAINTTLIEGRIKVINPTSKNPTSAILSPLDQALIQHSTLNIQHNTDISKVLAWKNGLFYFDGLDVQEAMRQLERWYDIEVVYEGAVPNIWFGGKMSRDVSLNGLLQMLSDSQLKFRIEGGRRLIIMN
jgi:ferric-dicitrate binding protein FerR (iron transport regulator)